MKGITLLLLVSTLLLCACQESDKALLYDQSKDAYYALKDFSGDVPSLVKTGGGIVIG